MASNPMHSDGNASNPTAGSATVDESIATALKSLIDRHGPSILGESGRLKSFLQDECPHAKREISVLMQALDEQVPQDLLRVQSGEPLQSLAPRLAKRLSDQKALAPGASNWAVRTWARGLGISAVAIDPLAASSLDDSVVPPAANEGWIDLSVPDRHGNTSFSQLPPFSEVPMQNTSGGTVAKPAKRWLAIVAALLVAIGVWVGFFYHSMAITRVDAANALVGDGKKQDVFVSFKPSSNVQGIQVRFVRGDGKWDSEPISINVGSDAAAQGRAPAGQIGMRTVKPAAVTFEYVLVAADGKRSEPFQKTFEIAAGPAQPPVIGAISVPRSVVVGKPFVFTIAYENGAGKVVQVERKVVESNVKWQADELTTKMSDLTSGKQGSVAYPFQAMNAPLHSTLEFTLVDADGVRSEPKRVVLDVVPPSVRTATADVGCTAASCGRVVSVREIEQKAEGTGLGAAIGGLIGGVLGHQIGRGRGNTAATIAGVAGGAFAGHEGEKVLRATKSYEVTVRMDNGSTRVVTQAGRVQNGERVRVSGNSAVAVSS